MGAVFVYYCKHCMQFESYVVKFWILMAINWTPITTNKLKGKTKNVDKCNCTCYAFECIYIQTRHNHCNVRCNSNQYYQSLLFKSLKEHKQVEFELESWYQWILLHRCIQKIINRYEKYIYHDKPFHHAKNIQYIQLLMCFITRAISNNIV